MLNTVHFIVACLVHRLILSNDSRLDPGNYNSPFQWVGLNQ